MITDIQYLASGKVEIRDDQRPQRIFDMKIVDIHQISRHQTTVEQHGKKDKKGQRPLFSIQNLLNQMITDIQYLASGKVAGNIGAEVAKLPATSIRMAIESACPTA